MSKPMKKEPEAKAEMQRERLFRAIDHTLKDAAQWDKDHGVFFGPRILGGDNTVQHALLDAVLDVLASTPAQGQDGWVSVEERLPEYGHEVIVYCPNKDRRQVTALARFSPYEGAEVSKGWWDNAYPGKGNMHVLDSVTYWRELPPSPEPGTGGE